MKKSALFLIALVITMFQMVFAQSLITEVNITIPVPKVGDNVSNALKVTSVTTNLNGGTEMLKKGELESPGFLMFYTRNADGRLVGLSSAVIESGMEYIVRGSVKNLTKNLFKNALKNGNYQTDNTMVKLTVNGKSGKILSGSAGRSLLFETTVIIPGERSVASANETVSPADGQFNGHGYVELGLPSGVKWATCNIGAATPQAYGDFFACGETKSKTTFTGKNFTGYGSAQYANPYHFTEDQEDAEFINETGNGGLINSRHDAARQLWGGEWRLPTRGDYEELLKHTVAKYMVINGIKGALLTSKVNGQSIFLPFAGRKFDDQGFKPAGKGLEYRGVIGYYWTATVQRVLAVMGTTFIIKNDRPQQADYDIFSANIGKASNGGDILCVYGLTIRPVYGGNPKMSTGSGRAKTSTKRSNSSSEKNVDAKKNLKKSGTKLLKDLIK